MDVESEGAADWEEEVGIILVDVWEVALVEAYRNCGFIGSILVLIDTGTRLSGLNPDGIGVDLDLRGFEPYSTGSFTFEPCTRGLRLLGPASFILRGSSGNTPSEPSPPSPPPSPNCSTSSVSNSISLSLTLHLPGLSWLKLCVLWL